MSPPSLIALYMPNTVSLSFTPSVPIICLAGPTGSGKTATAIAIAQACGGEVINADSRQVYRDFPIITAQPLPEEQAVCPHHLYGFLPSDTKTSAGQWAKEVAALARQIWERGRVPLVVGGTGLYFKTLLHGIAEIPPVSPDITHALTSRCAVIGSPALHAELEHIDPLYAARIHPNDRQRVIRALEVWQSTGRAFSWWHTNTMTPPLCQGPLLGLHVTLNELTPRLDGRIETMLRMGALDEARAARRLCPTASAPGWNGIGCMELLAFIEGRLTFSEARAQWLANTRAYAKRQLTWFTAQPELEWFLPHDLCSITERVQRALDCLAANNFSCSAIQAQ